MSLNLNFETKLKIAQLFVGALPNEKDATGLEYTRLLSDYGQEWLNYWAGGGREPDFQFYNVEEAAAMAIKTTIKSILGSRR